MTGLSTAAKDQFQKWDYRIMEQAFNIHNQMGSSHEEEVYQNELAYQIEKLGIHVEKEVPLKITYGTFEKIYKQDLLVEGEHIYELKALPALTDTCKSQLINYQLISEKPYGKLINFGTPSVEHHFVTSTLTLKERQQLDIFDAHWITNIDADEIIRTLSEDLFRTWGTRLSPLLYTEAILKLLPEAKETRIPITSGSRTVGSKNINLLTPNIAFKITTSKSAPPLYPQLQKFIIHTPLEYMHWINLNGNTITYQTLQKNNPVI